MRTLIWLLLLPLAFALASCRSVKTVYVPTESMTLRTDTVKINTLRVDSVLMRDSVSLVLRGDTVFLTRWRDRFRYRTLSDTVYVAKTDSVRVRVPYPVETEKRLSTWQKIKMKFGGYALGVFVLSLTALFTFVLWKSKNRPK